MQRRVNQDRLFSHIDAILHEHTEHSRDSLLNGAFSVDQLDHWSIQPYSLALWSLNALVAVVGALADDACCRYITGFQRMHECFAVYVYEHCAQRTYFLGYQSTEDLSRVSSSGRMVLNGILIQKRSACTVSKDQTVSGCTVMVGCREVVVVKTSRTTCCDDNGFCLCYLVLASLHVLENSTCNLSLIVFDQLYCGRELDHRNTAVDDFITQCSHDLCSRVVTACMHTFSGSSAAVCCYHTAVLIFIKHNAQVFQPGDCIRSFHYELAEQFRSCSKVSAAECIEIMLCRGVVLFVCCLDSTFCHHGVCITNSQFGGNHNVCASLVSLDSCRRTCSTGTDNQYIYVIIYFVKVDVNTEDTAVGLQQIAELCRNFLAFVRTDFQGDEAFLFIVRMICCKKGIFLIRCHSSWLCCHSLGSGSFYLFNRVLHIGQCIHSKFPPYFSISRLL